MRSLCVLAVCGLAASASAQVVYNNGGTGTTPGIISNPGAGGFGGNDVSRIIAPITAFGSTASGGFLLADDFTLGAGIQVASITVFGYMTGGAAPGGTVPVYTNPPASPITGVTINIWNGAPNAGGIIVATSNILGATGWTGITRTSATALTNTQRPVMFATATFAGENLAAGTYWIDFTFTGALGTNITVFTPPLTDATQTIAGNAIQFSPTTQLWAPAVSGGLNMDFPFYITAVPAPSAAAGLGLLGLAALRRKRA